MYRSTNSPRWVTRACHNDSTLLSPCWATNPSTKTWRSDLRASHSPLLYRCICRLGCLANLGLSVVSTKKISWSEIPGDGSIRLTREGEFVMKRSRMELSRVGKSTCWTRPLSAIISSKSRLIRPYLAPGITTFFCQSMSRRLKSPPSQTVAFVWLHMEFTVCRMLSKY